MRDSMLREQKDKLMMPMADQLFGAVHPNILSITALGVGLLAAGAVAGQFYMAGLILWLFNRILDGLDGVVARAHNKQSDFGGYLDLVLDFIVYLAIPIALLFAQPTQANLWAGIILLAVYVLNLLSWTTLSTLIEKRSLQSANRLTSVEMPTGIVEGAETIVFYCLFILFPAYVPHLFIAMSILVLITAAQRVWWAYYNL